VTVNYATGDTTATAGTDYTAGSGVVTFTAGTTTQTASVAVLGDVLDEPNETFVVNLSSPVNATVGDGQGVGTILDDDTLPTLAINDVTVTERNSGTRNLTFTVTLSAASGQTVAVSYATSDGTAVAGSDYSTRSGTLTFTPGATTRTFTVPALSDTVPEADETFLVTLSGPTNAALGDGQGVGTIVDNDGTVTVTVPNTAVVWPVGAARTITWTTSSNFTAGATFRVELSRDGGTSWEVLAAAVPNATATSGSYAWTVTGPVTTQGRVRVTWTVASRVTDISNSNFTIQ
jgi:hypothetical protein